MFKEDSMRYLAVVMTLAVMLAGCATAAPPESAAVDLTGRWSGTWEGYGVAEIKRYDAATAQFAQQGDKGYGSFWLEGTLASESVPQSLRFAGLTGVPVFYYVNGNRVVLLHQLDEKLFKAELTVTGDRMVGRLVGTEFPARIELERVPPPKAAVVPPPPAPVAAVPAPAAPPAPAPPPVVAVPAPPAPAPVEARPAPQDFSAADALRPVYFDFDRSDIRPSEKSVLDANASWLQTNGDVLLIVEGHCDERGTEAYNLALGERRARSARDYLVAQGVAANRITTISYGEERPVCREHNEDCWSQNRRAAFVIKPK
jgi:peptidoglycan-associated lipoprotein